jgi:hypothetical protein
MIQVGILIIDHSIRRSKNCGGFLKRNPVVALKADAE